MGKNQSVQYWLNIIESSAVLIFPVLWQLVIKKYMENINREKYFWLACIFVFFRRPAVLSELFVWELLRAEQFWQNEPTCASSNQRSVFWRNPIAHPIAIFTLSQRLLTTADDSSIEKYFQTFNWFIFIWLISVFEKCSGGKSIFEIWNKNILCNFELN